MEKNRVNIAFVDALGSDILQSQLCEVLHAKIKLIDTMRPIFYRKVLLAPLLAYLSVLGQGAEIAYCSPDNTGADTGYQAGVHHTRPRLLSLG